MSQITCHISGEILYKSDILLGFDLDDIHPCFKAKKSLILKPEWIFRFTAAKSQREKKLYYLAVLNSMDLITWKHPADPSLQIIEFTMMDAMRIACWIDYAKYGITPRRPFPQLIVSEVNYKLEDISVYLDRLLEIRKQVMATQSDEVRRREINEESQKIENEFRAAGLLGQAFTLPLARWALDVSDCPDEKYRRWLDILQTPLNEAWTFATKSDESEMHEVYEWLQENLPVTNDQCLAVRVQMRKLIEASQWGYKEKDDDRDDGEVDEDGLPKPSRAKPTSYQILPEDIQNPENYSLPPEPQRVDYPTAGAYYGAKALWDLEVKAARGGRRGEWKQF